MGYPDTFSGVFYDQQAPSADNLLQYIDRLSNDDVRHQLKESIGHIQRLVMQLTVLNNESEKVLLFTHASYLLFIMLYHVEKSHVCQHPKHTCE